MRIGLLVYPGCMPAGLFAASDHFQAISRRMGKPVFEPVWIGAGDARVKLGKGPVLAINACKVRKNGIPARRVKGSDPAGQTQV